MDNINRLLQKGRLIAPKCSKHKLLNLEENVYLSFYFRSGCNWPICGLMQDGFHSLEIFILH